MLPLHANYIRGNCMKTISQTWRSASHYPAMSTIAQHIPIILMTLVVVID